MAMHVICRRLQAWTWKPAGLVLLAAVVVAPAWADEPDEEMPELSEAEALALHQAPKAWMVNPVICERVSAVTDAGGRLVGHGGGVALYRQETPDKPFMRITTRKDSAYVARFPASPGEVIISRAYVRHPRTNQYVYGRATEVVCEKNDVEIGEITMTTGESKAQGTTSAEAGAEPADAGPMLEIAGGRR